MVISNLNGGEYLYSEMTNGFPSHEIRLNTEDDNVPNEPYSPELNGICHLDQYGCLYWAAQIHQYNLEHCDNSMINMGHFGNIIVIGVGCDIV